MKKTQIFYHFASLKFFHVPEKKKSKVGIFKREPAETSRQQQHLLIVTRHHSLDHFHSDPILKDIKGAQSHLTLEIVLSLCFGSSQPLPDLSSPVDSLVLRKIQNIKHLTGGEILTTRLLRRPSKIFRVAQSWVVSKYLKQFCV